MWLLLKLFIGVFVVVNYLITINTYVCMYQSKINKLKLFDMCFKKNISRSRKKYDFVICAHLWIQFYFRYYNIIIGL